MGGFQYCVQGSSSTGKILSSPAVNESVAGAAKRRYSKSLGSAEVENSHAGAGEWAWHMHSHLLGSSCNWVRSLTTLATLQLLQMLSWRSLCPNVCILCPLLCRTSGSLTYARTKGQIKCGDCRVVRRTRIVYTESIARVTSLSLSGKILYHMRLADAFFVQWTDLQRRFPRSTCCGRLF